jgi:hypothetical protein
MSKTNPRKTKEVSPPSSFLILNPTELDYKLESDNLSFSTKNLYCSIGPVLSLRVCGVSPLS